MRTLLPLAILIALLLAGCENENERRCRVAVKSLVAAPKERAAGELDKVVTFGRYALVDIEQEFHSAPIVGRHRLLDALGRLRLAEARPFLQFVARWEADADLRRQAEVLAQRR